MLLNRVTLILNHLQKGTLPLPRGGASASDEDAARRAMAQEPGYMPLSERLSRPERYASLTSARRGALTALLRVPATPHTAARAADMLCAVIEEPDWNGAGLPDEARPSVGFHAAETALLLTLALAHLRPHLEKAAPGLEARVKANVDRRVLEPVRRGSGLDFLSGEGLSPVAAACDCALTVLLTDADADMLRTCLRAIDDEAERKHTVLPSYAGRVADVRALCCFAQAIYTMTGARVDLRASIPTDAMLDEIFYPWITDDCFADPAGEGFTPAVSGRDLYAIGHAVSDEAIMALGRLLCQKNDIPSGTVLGQLADPALEQGITQPGRLPPRVLRGSTADCALMTVRAEELFCAMHIGGGRANAGDLVLFEGGRPVLFGPNVPVLGGARQWTPLEPIEADFKRQGEREIMSMNLTGAYPTRAGLTSYQRTLILMRPEKELRLVETLAFTAPQSVSFRFVCPEAPEQGKNEMRLGGIRLTWEGEYDPAVRARPDGMYTIEFNTRNRVSGGMFTFRFECC